MSHMNHIENPVIWKLFFLVCGLSSVAIVMAALGREAIWRPRDTFDRAFCNAFRVLGASAVIAILCFSYGVTTRCVAVENECQVYKELVLRGDTNADWGPAGRDGGVFGFVGAEIPGRRRSAPMLPNSESGVRASMKF